MRLLTASQQELGIDGRKEKWDGLSIQDPNNPMNNVSGGSHRAMHVFRLFSQAHEALQQRLETLDISGISILETIIGGNYESYTSHWNQLRRLT
jgi:non-canonical poly(A) RNA polymerase PAPD5/7